MNEGNQKFWRTYIRFIILNVWCSFGFACPAPWISDNSNPSICYIAPTPSAKTFQQAVNLCSDNNGSLPSFNDSTEYKNFVNLLTRGSFGSIDEHIWLSLHISPNLFIRPPYNSDDYLWDGSYRSNFYLWKAGTKLLKRCASTVDKTNQNWQATDCITTKNIICQQRSTNVCPTGFIGDNSGRICYNFTKTLENADNAQLRCQQLFYKSTLPVFRNNIEYRNFVNHTNYAKVIFLQYWLGAKRECAPWPQTSPFLWLDKSPMTFKHWQTSELNSGSLYCTIVYNYVKNHMWDFTACSLWYYTVCQFRLLSPIKLFPADVRESSDCTRREECPGGFKRDSSRKICYSFPDMVVNASEADLYCQQSYSLSTLPVFRNYSEFQNFVRLPKFKSAKKYWIGARRICNSVAKNTSSFLWLDASPVELQWWNNTGPSVVEENCVVFYSNATNKYTWRDFSCTENVYPVCQFRIQSPIFPVERYESDCFVNNTAIESTTVLSSSGAETSAITSFTTTSGVVTTATWQMNLTNQQTITIPVVPKGVPTTMMASTGAKFSATASTAAAISGAVVLTSIATTTTVLTTEQMKLATEQAATTTSIPIDCFVSEWGDYSECSVTCGKYGQKIKKRRIVEISQNGSQSCPSLEQQEPCQAEHLCLPMAPLEQKIAIVFDKAGCIYIIGQISASLITLGVLRSFSYGRFLQIGQEVSLLTAHILILAYGGRIDALTLCKVVATLLQYFFMANFMFLMLETFQCYVILSNVLTRGNMISIKCCYVASFGLTLIPTLFSTWIGWNNLLSPFTCWLNLSHSFSLGTVVPLFLIVIITVTTWESIGMHHAKRYLYCSKRLIWEAKVAKHALFFKIPMNLAAWYIGVVALHYQMFSLHTMLFGMNIALGTTIFVFHTLADQRTRDFALKLWHCIKK